MCEERNRILLIGEKAPEFVAETNQGIIHFPQDCKGKWVIFFPHPADSIPVCTTEFMTFASMADGFKAFNGISGFASGDISAITLYHAVFSA